MQVTHELLVAEAPYVVARWTTTEHPARELSGIPASGKEIRWGGTDTYRIEDGRIVEWWRNDDFAGLLRRLSRQARDRDGARGRRPGRLSPTGGPAGPSSTGSVLVLPDLGAGPRRSPPSPRREQPLD